LDQVLPAGLAFIWVEKETIADVRRIISLHNIIVSYSQSAGMFQAVKLFTSWGFTYVENLCWIRRYPNHSIVTEDYDYFTKSKGILLIFKRGDGIHLRHQRNPDVIFDYVRRDKYLAEDKPENIYDIIETLLPEGNYKEETHEGRFLELYVFVVLCPVSVLPRFKVSNIACFLWILSDGDEKACRARVGLR
jgi:hypothetical protein